ncbi:MAG: RagB/SusD family nutrient uptake outer membrane protein [Bacteroidota bacterium]
MKAYWKYLLLLVGISFIATSCFNDLETTPIDPDEVTGEDVFKDLSGYTGLLAKLYAGLAVSGQQGPAGQADIQGIDEGFGQYLRALWYHQELATDEAVIAWNDQTIQDFHQQDWTSGDAFIFAFYSRIFYQISVCNEFLRQTEEGKLNERGISAGDQAIIQTYRAEARFLRALSYWHALDHFRNVPFVTEDDIVGAFFPEQIQAPDLYNYIESELLEIESQMTPARQAEYGRADQGAAWMLLAKLYLNAEVYTDKPAYTECIEFCQRIIDAGYTLEPEHGNLFRTDNDQSDEIIFSIPFDGIDTRTWGGTTFIVRAGIGGEMNAVQDFGVESGWGGTRVTSALVNKFPAVASEEGGGFIVMPAPEPDPEEDELVQIFVPGNFVGWSPANAPALTSPEDDMVYEGYLFFPESNTQFKITPERSFTGNYGDDDADGVLDLNGENILVEEAGYYRLRVDLNDLTYTLDRTEWGLIGSATADGWDSDQDMTYDIDEQAWVIETNLVSGAIKFRANDAWDLNYGDDAADAILDEAGADIMIASNGNYRIKLFLSGAVFTYSVELTSSDQRGTFFTEGQTLEIADIAQFTEGYASTKFRNVSREGTPGSSQVHVDVDFPLFRLADTYLMYAEAVVRNGSGGSIGTAVEYVNRVLTRAYGDTAGNISASDLDLPFLLDERARELFWEAQRRTDLVRFGQFSDGDYRWPWKGGEPEGVSVSDHFDVYPIPAADLGANPNLQQNRGY